MSLDETVRALIEDAARPAQLREVRAVWVRETVEALRRAQAHMDERCLDAVDRVPEAEFSRIFDEEQAKVCAILDQLHAVRDHDRWPRHLYFGGL